MLLSHGHRHITAAFVPKKAATLRDHLPNSSQITWAQLANAKPQTTESILGKKQEF